MTIEPEPGTPAPAFHVYRVRIVPAARLSRWLRTGWLVLLGLLNMGDTPSNPGGRQAHVVERASGRVVTTINEVIGDDDSNVDRVADDVQRMDVDEFTTHWL